MSRRGRATIRNERHATILKLTRGAYIRENAVGGLRAKLLNGQSPLYLHNPLAEDGWSLSDAGVGASWWPTHRFAGVHLARYLGTHGDLRPVA